jgi:hypothetical protein
MQPSEMSSPLDGKETEIRTTFVTRLERLIQTRRDRSHDMNPLGLRLLDHSIQTTYQDCIDSGAYEVARRIMSRHTPAAEGR